jgi:phosphatidylglycerol:prolipoprotein diacylglycerol transferase
MHPLLFKIPGLNVPIYTYGFMIMIGFLAAIGIAVWRGKKKGITSDFLLDMGLVVLVAGIVGARLTYLGFEDHDIDLAIFNIFDLYGFNWIGFVVGAAIPSVWLYRRSANEDRPKMAPGSMAGMAVAIILAGLVVGRALTIWQKNEYAQFSFEAFAIWKGGIVLYGGLIFGTISGAWWVWKKGLSISGVADVIAPSIAVGVAFGRVGCYLNGCCWGTVCETDGLLSARFPAYSENVAEVIGRHNSLPLDHHISHGLVDPTATLSAPVYLTQLMEAFFMFAVVGLLIWITPRIKRQGLLLPLLALIYGAWRFGIEFLRGDNERFGGAELTFSQYTSFGIIAVGLVFFLWMWKRNVAVAENLAAGPGNSGDSAPPDSAGTPGNQASESETLEA